jgi:hypothetical protein
MCLFCVTHLGTEGALTLYIGQRKLLRSLILETHMATLSRMEVYIRKRTYVRQWVQVV